jgi:hypothetical protein
MTGGIEKEFSVDLLGQRVVDRQDQEESDDPIADLQLLIECKYRRPNISWLFLPEVQGQRISRRPIVRTIADFSNMTGIKVGPDVRLPHCYKGVEVDLGSRDRHRVSDEELRRGFEQLQYGLAAKLKEIVETCAALLDFEDTNSVPAFVMPVLVTTAPLFVAVEEFDSVDLTLVSTIDEFAHRVPA